MASGAVLLSSSSTVVIDVLPRASSTVVVVDVVNCVYQPPLSASEKAGHATIRRKTGHATIRGDSTALHGAVEPCV
jgi:hypothetical protein